MKPQYVTVGTIGDRGAFASYITHSIGGIVTPVRSGQEHDASGTILGTLALGMTSSPFLAAYTSGGSRVAAPASLPVGAPRSMVWSSGSLLISHVNSGFFALYPWSGNTFGAKTEFSGFLTTQAGGIALNPSENYLAIHGLSGQFSVFEVSGNSFGLRVSGPGSGIIGGATTRRTVDWHPSGNFLSVIGVVSPSVYSYQFSSGYVGGFFTASGAATNSIAWQPNGNFVAVGMAAASPFLAAYLFTSGSFLPSQIPSPALPQMANMQYVAWSPDGQYLAAAGTPASGRNQGLFIFPFSSGFGTEVSGCGSWVDCSGTQCSGSVGIVEWSRDGSQIAMGFSWGRFYSVYHWGSSGFLGRVTPLASGPTAANQGMAWRSG